MIVVDVVRSKSTLRLRLAGNWGGGEENLRSGRAVQSALAEALVKDAEALTEVVIDYSDVHGLGGDGPTWSTAPAMRRKLDVRFVASGENHSWLSEFLSATNMDRLIRLDGEPRGTA